MTSDPRLRLIGTTDSAAGAQVLHALDSARIVIRTAEDMTAAHTGALAAFVGMVGRLFGEVALDPPVNLTPNWWGAADTTELLALLADVRPRPAEPARHDIVVTFGDRAGNGHFSIGGDDYTVRLGLDAQPLGPGSAHSFGVHAASCLAVSQLLGTVLAPLGFAAVEIDDSFVMNLIDYTLTPAPDGLLRVGGPRPTSPLPVTVAGVGSVGTSALALIASALADGLSPSSSPPAAERIDLELVDADALDPVRNPFRYPALLGTEAENKAIHLAARLSALGLPARPHATRVADWARGRPEPGYDGLLISSVDTLAGRLDVTDVLARRTLSVGVAGLALHAQREGFADGFACSFCDYVSARPPLTQAGSHARTTGLPVSRILALLQPDATLEPSDVDIAIATGKVPPDRRERLVGAPLSDLVRQAYAELSLHATDAGPQAGEVLTVAAPQVSWFAGVLIAVEVLKQIEGLPLLDRRVDVDLGGLPPGLVRRPPADATGRCLCRSGVRIRWYRAMYGAGDSNTRRTSGGDPGIPGARTDGESAGQETIAR
jgi:hypothetical protein